ncbi:serine hydrolase [Aliiglaciecola sp. M165]|nr:serine hydrolase [Aliiglaciecola sp. M165]
MLMIFSFNPRNLIKVTALLALYLNSSFVAFGAQEKHSQAPKATAEEARIKHWNVPEIERNFWDIPELENAFFDISPTDYDDGILVGDFADKSVDEKKIIALAEEIADKQHAEVDSLLIAHQGKLVFESYFSRGRIDLPHPQSSTTKSYTGLAIGRAIQLGYLSMADLDKPLVSFLKGLDPSKFSKGVDKITLRNAMAMQSGLQISPEQIEEYRKNLDNFVGIKQIQAFLEDSAEITDASQSFVYQGLNPDMLMYVVEAAVPGSAADFVEKELFHKMGIVNYDWRADQSGMLAAGGGSSMTSRDMLKLGTLVMNKGKWNGEQLIPKSFIEQSTSKNVQLSVEQVQDFYSGENLSNSGYGYLWWQTDLRVGDKQYQSVSAQGGGGVTILFVKELDLLVVVTAHARQAYLQMIAEKVLPAFIT